jgi:hypothetical protein
MIVTLNEVEQWCLRAMAGSGAPPGVDEDAAAAAAWLTARGFLALEALIAALDRWRDDPSATELSETSSQSPAQRVDAGGRSAVFLAGALIDGALAAAKRTRKPTTLHVERLTDPIFLLPVTLPYARRGWAFELSWRTAEPQVAVGAQVIADGPFLLGDECRLLDAGPVSLSIGCGQETLDGGAEVAVRTEELSRRYAATLARGVEVADETWAALKTHGRRALVPASAESRARGAGAETSDNE